VSDFDRGFYVKLYVIPLAHLSALRIDSSQAEDRQLFRDHSALAYRKMPSRDILSDDARKGVGRKRGLDWTELSEL